jgi:DNA-binding transcriptional MerR regulator
MASVYKIGVVSRRTGLSASTLRLWEDQFGLLAPARTAGGTRLYSESDIERVLYVRHLVCERGYALGAIAAIIDDAAASVPHVLDRVAIENIYLRDATIDADVQDGRRMAAIQATVRGVMRAESAERAAFALVAGVKSLTVAPFAGLGLYQRRSHRLVPVVAARGERIGMSSQPPLPIARFPREWQQAIDAREPYADADLLRIDLPVEVSARVMEDRARSFHAEPLAIAGELIGILAVASSRPGGVGREAELVCEELAIAAGPAIHYFARQLEATPSSQPRL